MKMNGIEFFPFSAVSKGAVKMIEAEFKAVGLAIYVKLLQQIFSYEGYYLVADKDAVLIVKQELGIDADNDIVDRVIKSCIERDLFDKKMYEDYNILTSDDIQKDYLIAVKRRKNIILNENYLLPSILNELVNLAGKVQMYAENEKMYAKIEKMYAKNEKMLTFFNREEKTIEDNTIQDNTIVQHTEKNSREEKNGGLFFSGESKQRLIKKSNMEFDVEDNADFRTLTDYEFTTISELYPDKAIKREQLVPINFELEKFICCIKESDFLSNAKNISLTWLCNNYEMIITRKYKTYQNKVKDDFITNIDLL